MPPLPNFCAPSGAPRSQAVSVEHTRNLYLDEIPNQKGAYALLGMPGLKPFLLLPSGPVRGLYQTTTGRTFAVTSTSLYELFSGGTFLARGTVHTGTPPVSMVDDGLHLVLSVDGVGYGYELATDTLTTLPLTGPQTWGRLGYIDGRILTVEPGTRLFWYTDIFAATTWPALNFYSAEGKPDILVTLMTDHREVYLVGSQTVEVWMSTGDSLSPFARNSATFIEQGGEAPMALAAANNTLYWLGGSSRGEGPIWRLEGFTPRRVSTAAIETAMGRMSTVGDCIAFPVSYGGHSWVGWHFPAGNETWLYDTNLDAWTELTDLEDDGSFSAFRAYAHAYSAGEHVWGDRVTGQCYRWDPTWHGYGDRPIVGERICMHLRSDQQRIRYHAFELVMQTGVGLDGGVVPGSDPQVMLSYSDDQGHSWSQGRWRSAGKRGAAAQQVIWRQLGQSRQRAFRVRITDPVCTAILGARVEVG